MIIIFIYLLPACAFLNGRIKSQDENKMENEIK
jgi:hypothetical protein